MIGPITHVPTVAQRKYLRKWADNSFCVTAPDDFGVPEVRGYKPDPGTITALSLKNVQPHDDPWVGKQPEPEGDDRRSVFWLVDFPENEILYLQVGTEFKAMRRYEYVVFDDSVLHSVQANRKWWGVAYQLRATNTALGAE